MASDPRLGVSGSMSTEPPSSKDIKLDEALLRELRSRKEFEGEDETKRRYAEHDTHLEEVHTG